MGTHVTSGAMLACSFGAAPGTLTVLPANRVHSGGPPGANIMDNKPNVNIAPFGVCSSLANPAVAAATAAAQGVLTPQPCVPATVAPWAPGVPTVKIGYQPAIDNTCTLACTWAGVITVTNPGQTTVNAGPSGGGGGGASAAAVAGGEAGKAGGGDAVAKGAVAGAVIGAIVGAALGAALGPVGMVVGAAAGAILGATIGAIAGSLFAKKAKQEGTLANVTRSITVSLTKNLSKMFGFKKKED